MPELGYNDYYNLIRGFGNKAFYNLDSAKLFVQTMDGICVGMDKYNIKQKKSLKQYQLFMVFIVECVVFFPSEATIKYIFK